MAKKTALEQFKHYTETCYSGKRLLEQHSLDEHGYWKILGEDPNADLHGAHYQPDLGTVEGKLRDVIMYAVMLPQFWQWGAGGDFKFLGKSILKIDEHSAEVRQELEEQAARLKAELDEVNRLLGKK